MSCQLTVLMAVRNGEPYVRTAIESILEQTYAEFIFLIVDDASTDNTRETVRSYHDDRIRLHCLDQNVGQTAALNIGFHQASTTWIARMDADDYSAPTRLEEQMRALNADNTLKCVGTFAWTFRDEPTIVEQVLTRPVHYDDIKRMVAVVPIIHGSMIVDRAALIGVGGYNDRYLYSADLEMFDRLLAKHAAANIPKQLLGVRYHDGQGSRTRVAIDETIEILDRKLAVKDYSRVESAAAHAYLCRAYLERSRHMLMEKRYSQAPRDLLRGFRYSKKMFVWYLIKVSAMYLLSHRQLIKLKSLIPGLTSSRTL